MYQIIIGLYLLYNAKKISIDQFADNVIESLKCTVDEKALMSNKEKFFTRSELLCIHDLAFDIKTNVSELCANVLEEFCDEKRLDKKESRISMREWLMARWAGQLGNEGKYEESSAMSDAILKECLVHYRMNNLWDHIYNIIWNYQQTNLQHDAVLVNKKIKMCLVLAVIIKKYNVAAFFKIKLQEE